MWHSLIPDFPLEMDLENQLHTSDWLTIRNSKISSYMALACYNTPKTLIRNIYFLCLWKNMSNSFIYFNSPISINLDYWWRLVFPTTLWQICNARNKNVFKDQAFETMISFHRIRTLSTDSLLLTLWVISWWPANSHMKHRVKIFFSSNAIYYKLYIK